MQPCVSIITPAYNAGRFITQTIESVLRQSYQRWEMLVADDCSVDATCSIVESFAARDKRIRLLRGERNLGPGPSRNRALAVAQGRYVAFLDADDLWDPPKLEFQVSHMQRLGHAFTFHSYRTISESGAPLGSIGDVPVTQSYRQQLKNTAIGCLTVMLDRDQVGEVEFPPLKRSQDTALWLSLLRRGLSAHGIGRELATYRVVATSNTGNKWKSARSVWRLYRERERVAVLPAAWYFANYAWNAWRRHRRVGAWAETLRGASWR